MPHLRVAIYHNLHSGGARRVVAEHIHRLGNRYDLSVFSLKSANHTFAEDEHTHVPILLADYRPLPMARSPFGRINPCIGIINVMRYDLLSRKMAAAIDRMSFDVVVVHPCQITQAPLLLRWLRTPTLYYCHELPRRLYEPPIERPYLMRRRTQLLVDQVDPFPRVSRVMLRRMDRLAATKATQIITNSMYTRTNIYAAYQRKAEVCYPAVDATKFQPYVQQRETSVLSVGALTPAKGFDFLIEAIATIPTPERPPLILISNYQESAEYQYLTQLATERHVQLQCHVGLSEADLQGWYARVGCVAYAPVREPLGLVALEAMATGAPLVGVAEGGVRETILEGSTGMLSPRDPVAFGQAIQWMLSHPEQAKDLGNAARHYVQARWTWELHMERFEQLLFATIGAR